MESPDRPNHLHFSGVVPRLALRALAQVSCWVDCGDLLAIGCGMYYLIAVR